MSNCIYCKAVKGKPHKIDCVAVYRKVKIRVIIEYEVSEPYSWDKNMIEFHRNKGSWCADNIFDELKEYVGEDGCICGITSIQCIDENKDGEPFLNLPPQPPQS